MNDDPAYKNLDFQRISTLTRNPIIYDTRYCLSPKQVTSHLTYHTTAS